MMINEQNIFDFVFYPETISGDVIAELKTNPQFKERIAFYKSMKEEISTPLSFQLKHKLANKIPAYSFSNCLKLFPVDEDLHSAEGDRLSFAADSPNVNQSFMATTFIDESKNFLARFIPGDKEVSLFILSVTDQLIKEFKVTLYPTNEIYTCADNAKPIQLSSSMEITSISLELL
ncbi:MAG: hypothetical protein WC209_17160 [Ignavibacteriaceae bacterium]|jgi:hypothetical protein